MPWYVRMSLAILDEAERLIDEMEHSWRFKPLRKRNSELHRRLVNFIRSYCVEFGIEPDYANGGFRLNGQDQRQG